MRSIHVHLVSSPFRVMRGLSQAQRKNYHYRADAHSLGDLLEKQLNRLIDVCSDMRLRVGEKQARRVLDGHLKDYIEAFIAAESESEYLERWDQFERVIGYLELSVEDDLSFIAHLELTPDQSELYESIKPFGDDVAKAFPSTRLDIEEAAKCLALDRATACVFHLMRAIEIALRVFGKSLKDPRIDPYRNPSWEAILGKCRAQVDLPLAKRCDEWRVDDAFFSEATANLTVVKNAWRNPTLHPGKSYDPERAREVFLAVKAFMRHLAAKLSEGHADDQVVE